MFARYSRKFDLAATEIEIVQSKVGPRLFISDLLKLFPICDRFRVIRHESPAFCVRDVICHLLCTVHKLYAFCSVFNNNGLSISAMSGIVNRK
jgi:hypothetical protein